MIGATTSEILVEVSVKDPEPNFMPLPDANPLDNEHPDTNSDGVQLHLTFSGSDSRLRSASWLMVPDAKSHVVRVTARDDAVSVPMTARWRQTDDGWQLLTRVAREAIGPADSQFGLDVMVNEMPPSRERRRGQLVMSATNPGWAYLRGDRQEPDQLVPMTVRNV
jgi:hypothetical protein